MDSEEENLDSKITSKIVREVLLNFLEPYSQSPIGVGETRIELYEREGELESSYKILRKKFSIPMMKAEDDFHPHPEAKDISIFTASSWYNRLSEQQEKELIKAVILELQILELPMSLIENYIERLMYGGKLVVPMAPIYSIYALSLVEDILAENLTTSDKKWISLLFRGAFRVPTLQGRMRKEHQEAWKLFQLVISGKSDRHQLRRLKNMKVKLASLEKRDVEASVRLNSEEEPDDLDSITWEEMEDKDRKTNQSMRKHRERKNALMKRVREKRKK